MFFCKLFLLHYWQYLRQEYRYKCDKSDEDNLATRIEEYRRHSEKCSECVDDSTNLALRESELEETKMEMEGLVALHWIGSLHDASHYHIDEVDEVDTENWDGGSNLTSRYYRQCSNQEGKHDGPRVTHNEASRNICLGEEIGYGDDDSEDHEEEAAIFLAGFSRVSEVELECESTEDDEGDEWESTCESRNSVREIHRIEHDYIPKYRNQEREVVESDVPVEDIEAHEEIIEFRHATKDMTDIGNLDARESDDGSDANLHRKTYNRGYTERKLSNSIHIIEETHERDANPNHEHNRESLEKEGREVPVEKYNRAYQEKHQENNHSSTIRDRLPSSFWLIEVWSVEEIPPSPQ